MKNTLNIPPYSPDQRAERSVLKSDWLLGGQYSPVLPATVSKRK